MTKKKKRGTGGKRRRWKEKEEKETGVEETVATQQAIKPVKMYYLLQCIFRVIKRKKNFKGNMALARRRIQPLLKRKRKSTIYVGSVSLSFSPTGFHFCFLDIVSL